MNSVKILGLIFFMMSGLVYTLERTASMIASYVYVGGWHAGGRTGEVPQIALSGFMDNIFAPIFLSAGIICLIYGFMRSKK